MFQSYTNKQLDNIAHDNYEILRKYCQTLEVEGYWDGVKAVLKQSIYAFLDVYVQTVLVKLALYCHKLDRDEKRFISELPDINMFDIDPNEPMEQRVLDETDKIFNSPPILLQLCGLRDLKMKTGMQSLFFDALLNIQLAMAFGDTGKTNLVAAFIRDYYTRVEAFFGTESNYGSIVNERYIFKKLCSEALSDSAANLKKAGDSFDKYCEISAIEGTPIIPSKVNLKAEAPSREAVAIKKIVNTEVEEQPVNSLKDASDLDRLLKELDDLVGLEAVKAEVRSLINLIKVRALRKKHGLPLMDMSYHMVFTGNPGTGKTTVARLIAGIYRELGILSKGTLVETDRSGLVAGYVGQTAIKVRDVVNKALGGVLFIDEAYALVNQFSNDFGDEALETLVKLMEDHRDDLVVIVAGYTEEMQNFLKANTGLTSRFNKFIAFKDYSNEELIEILRSMAVNAGFKIDDAAISKCYGIIENMNDTERADFGNARGIRNLFERIVINQANRISDLSDPTVEELTKITADDVRK